MYQESRVRNTRGGDRLGERIKRRRLGWSGRGKVGERLLEIAAKFFHGVEAGEEFGWDGVDSGARDKHHVTGPGVWRAREVDGAEGERGFFHEESDALLFGILLDEDGLEIGGEQSATDIARELIFHDGVAREGHDEIFFDGGHEAFGNGAFGEKPGDEAYPEEGENGDREEPGVAYPIMKREKGIERRGKRDDDLCALADQEGDDEEREEEEDPADGGGFEKFPESEEMLRGHG